MRPPAGVQEFSCCTFTCNCSTTARRMSKVSDPQACNPTRKTGTSWERARFVFIYGRPDCCVHSLVTATRDRDVITIFLYDRLPLLVLADVTEGRSSADTGIRFEPFLRRLSRSSLRAAPCSCTGLQSTARTFRPQSSRKVRERYAY